MSVAYARINLIIGTPETGKFKNYNITAEGDNHRTIETTNTFFLSLYVLAFIETLTSDKSLLVTLDLYKDVVITVPDNATDIGSYKVTITPKELKKMLQEQLLRTSIL